jgi:molybdopterin molybdotransferase
VKTRTYTIELELLQRKVRSSVRIMGTEKIKIEECRGRILAESLRTEQPFPPENRSAMDGFAMRSADIATAAPRRLTGLRILETVAAGATASVRVTRGSAVRIMTGAPMPDGADTVVRVEDTVVEDEYVLIAQPQQKFHDVRRRGVDMRKGQIALRKGSPITASGMAMCAMLDQPRVTVYKRPRVGIISTGDELGEVGRRRPHGHIPDSNRYGLLGMIASAGCTPVDGRRCGDDPHELEKQLRVLARRCDFVITTGGVSAGDFDVVKVLFRRIGGVKLYRLPIKPGKPQAFGKFAGVPFFGLPGNPVSSMVVFDFLVRPALRRMAGAKVIDSPSWPAIAGADFPGRSRKWEFVRVSGTSINGSWHVSPCASQRSSDLRSMTEADGYVTISPGSSPPKRGDQVLFTPFVS